MTTSPLPPAFLRRRSHHSGRARVTLESCGREERGEVSLRAQLGRRKEAVREEGLYFPWWDEDTRSENTFHSYANARDREKQLQCRDELAAGEDGVREVGSRSKPQNFWRTTARSGASPDAWKGREDEAQPASPREPNPAGDEALGEKRL